ncbi:unnamed protein product [Paramecium sonneborni]|uniref:LITAF domain-containing protein n=1 Tax=Paramecium sonneborni TaxID=65129 RepID=A0A8S1NGM9_9CILI|nr:unnamed protein product [Paramecium sonneborni]CAD8091214.1 unnamed protein product [Paramecium sonneborni]
MYSLYGYKSFSFDLQLLQQMEQNIVCQAYPALDEKQHQKLGQEQKYQKEQNKIPVCYPNQQYILIQQQQPFMNPQQIILQPIIIQQVRRSDANECSYPTDILCPYCQKPVQTMIEHNSGCSTWLACLFLFLFFLPLFFLPFCLEECKDKVHICPNCYKKSWEKEIQNVLLIVISFLFTKLMPIKFNFIMLKDLLPIRIITIINYIKNKNNMELIPVIIDSSISGLIYSIIAITTQSIDCIQLSLNLLKELKQDSFRKKICKMKFFQPFFLFQFY